MYNIVTKELYYSFHKPKKANWNTYTEKSKLMERIMLKQFIHLLKENRTFIFIDECIFNGDNKSFKNWYKTHDSEILAVPGRIQSVKLLLAVSKNEIVNSWEYYNNTNQDIFLDFLKETYTKILNSNENNKKIIQNKFAFYLDNATYHCTKSIRDYAIVNKIKLLYATPYKCLYNMAEYIFEDLKSVYYNAILYTK